jgi:hypothetical protein
MKTHGSLERYRLSSCASVRVAWRRRYHHHNLGVWWSGYNWTIFNQEVSTLVTGHSFNVMWAGAC